MASPLTTGPIRRQSRLRMREGDHSDRVPLIRFDDESGEFKPDKDWSAFDACETCRGAAGIDETPDGDLICATCRATLPRPEV